MSNVLSESPDRGDDDGATIKRDQLFKLLSNERRRHVIQYLRAHPEPVTLDTLAIEVAAKENDTSTEAVTSAERKRVYTALQQTHLPKMDRAGALAFDKDRGVIEPTDSLTEFTLYLDVVSSTEVPQSVVYLALAALGVVLAVGVWADAPVVSQVSPFWWATVTVASFAAVAAAERFFGRHSDDP